MSDLRLLEGLAAIVQCRGNGTRAWETIAAFDVPRVALGYADECRSDGYFSSREYRVLTIDGAVVKP